VRRAISAGLADQGREIEYTLGDVIDVFESREDYAEPLTASEVAAELDCSQRTALNTHFRHPDCPPAGFSTPP